MRRHWLVLTACRPAEANLSQETTTFHCITWLGCCPFLLLAGSVAQQSRHQGATATSAQTHERPEADLSQNTMPALIMGVMLASTVLQQKHSMSMKLSSSESRMWRLATSPVLVARKEARVRQARGCLRNSAQQNIFVPGEQAAQKYAAA